MFPKNKTNLVIKTKGLPNLPKIADETFKFQVLLQKDGFKLIIPGTPRGLDLVIAHSEKQENWLKEIERTFESGFKETWYCLWEVDNEKVLERFVEIIEPNILEKKYL